jgi:hypothetical protein
MLSVPTARREMDCSVADILHKCRAASLCGCGFQLRWLDINLFTLDVPTARLTPVASINPG